MATKGRHRAAWTDEERARLRAMWQAGDRIATIARVLERSRRAVYLQAQGLGIQVGCPAGFEYLSRAAERVGFASAAELRMVLEWSRVRVCPAYSRDGVNKWSRHFVDPVEVDDAVANWCRAESVMAAARRLEISPTTLYKWLRAIGVSSNRRGTRRMWRLDPDVVDKAAARAALRRELRGADPCVDCRAAARATGRTRCAPCGIRNSERTAAWQLQRFHASKCVRCGAPHDSDLKRCTACLEIDSAQRGAA